MVIYDFHGENNSGQCLFLVIFVLFHIKSNFFPSGIFKMWSSWWRGVGSLRQRVSVIVNVSHGYGGKFHPFDPPLLGLRDFAVECGGRKGGVASVSVFVGNQFVRGVSSSTFVSSSAGGSNSKNSSGNGGVVSNGIEESSISFSEAKKLMRLVNVESLKTRLGMEGKEIISYVELLEACESMGVAKNPEEAAAFAKVLDEAGVILLFRDKVYLHPDKVSFYYFIGPPFSF